MSDGKKYESVMIDIETMSTKQSAAIVSIAALKFDFDRADISDEVFYRELDYTSQERHIDDDTKSWWMDRSDEVKKQLEGIDDLESTLIDLNAYIDKHQKVWGNGATFDITILENAFEQCAIKPKWNFWDVRDCRTVLHMYNAKRDALIKSVNSGQSHNALDDCKSQCKTLIKMWNFIKK